MTAEVLTFGIHGTMLYWVFGTIVSLIAPLKVTGLQAGRC